MNYHNFVYLHEMLIWFIMAKSCTFAMLGEINRKNCASAMRKSKSFSDALYSREGLISFSEYSEEAFFDILSDKSNVELLVILLNVMMYFGNAWLGLYTTNSSNFTPPSPFIQSYSNNNRFFFFFFFVILVSRAQRIENHI